MPLAPRRPWIFILAIFGLSLACSGGAIDIRLVFVDDYSRAHGAAAEVDAINTATYALCADVLELGRDALGEALLATADVDITQPAGASLPDIPFRTVLFLARLFDTRGTLIRVGCREAAITRGKTSEITVSLLCPLFIPGCQDKDGDGFRAEEDCDDENPHVYPGAEERCDGVDNNCNGVIDEGCCYPDCAAKACAEDDGCGSPCIVPTCNSNQHCTADGCICNEGYEPCCDICCSATQTCFATEDCSLVNCG